MVAQILCIGVSDSCGGTGLQADIKTIMALGGYAATVATAVSVQNTHSVYDIYQIPADIVEAQVKAVLEDLAPKVMKTGMLSSESTINVVGDFMDEHKDSGMKFVIDPVMTSRIGKMLLDKPARDALKRRLLIYADVLTPNLREAHELTGVHIKDIDDMKHAAEMLRTLGARAVIIKGGALEADKVYNVYCDDNGIEVFEMPRLYSKATHGAGTTLSSGIASGLAAGLTTRESFVKAQEFLQEAMLKAGVIGRGYGPVNHACRMKG